MIPSIAYLEAITADLAASNANSILVRNLRATTLEIRDRLTHARDDILYQPHPNVFEAIAIINSIIGKGEPPWASEHR